jgi:hypothetical protein
MMTFAIMVDAVADALAALTRGPSQRTSDA